MTAGSASIRLQLLVRPEWRTADGMAAVQRAVRSAGLTVTGVGLASVSARTTADSYATLFGPEAHSGAAEGAALEVPEPLDRYVASITIAPRHQTMRQGRPKRREDR